MDFKTSCQCTKVGALLFTPLLVHGQSEPHLRPHLAGQREEAKAQEYQRHKEQEGEVESPGKTLAGAASAAPARALPGQLAQRQ